MKKIFVLLVFICFALPFVHTQNKINCPDLNSVRNKKSIKLGIVLYSNDPETIWNALRFANFSLSGNDTVSIFLLGKGVEIDNISITNKDFDIAGQLNNFILNGGKIYACSICMYNKKINASKTCPVSTLDKLYEIIRESDKLITF